MTVVVVMAGMIVMDVRVALDVVDVMLVTTTCVWGNTFFKLESDKNDL